MPELQETIKQIKKLHVDAIYEKKKHFNAANRKNKYHLHLGCPAILINIILGSALFFVFTEQWPTLIKWAGGLLCLLAAILVGLATFLNPKRIAQGHHHIANRYLNIAKKCDRLIAYHRDGVLCKEEVIARLEEIAQEYTNVTNDANAFPTSEKDYQRAKKGIEEGEEDYTEEELNRS